MTTVEIKKESDRIVYVKVSGHSEYAESGEDIVCAGISSIINTAVLGVKNIVKIDILKTMDEESSIIELVVPDNTDSKKDGDIQIVLNTMICGLNDLAESYPNNITIKEI